MKFIDWGEIAYEEALNKQLELVHLVAEGDAEECIVFCTHPPVVTLGRKTQSDDVTTWKGSVLEVQRGGRATYHGPSQVVAYPILDLNKRGRDLHKLIRDIEKAVIDSLIPFEVTANLSEGNTGVWIGERKIASIGIAVKKWVSYHGVAVNIDHDPEAHKGLNPCGFSTETMISLEELTKKKVPHALYKEELSTQFIKYFSV